ncbi:MAG: double-strand break repair helicase AddA [bacterium]|nr:double-strand break repair helicase AddA [bacterium]
MSTTNQTAQEAVVETTRRQAQAAEPFGSRWVSANAGTGKTHVLVQRVLRLLLAGAKPDTILCLTYTNAAAAEMENRLYERLSTWAVMSHEELQQTLAMLLAKTPDDTELKLARTLFATTLETAGGLKVQTIHSFCDRLLRRFPLEAEIAPNSSLLDEAAARELKTSSIERILLKAAKKPDSPLGQALTTVIAFTSEDGFNGVINEALGKRNLIKTLVQHDKGGRDPFEKAIARLYDEFGLAKSDGEAGLRQELAQTITDQQIDAVYEALNTGGGIAAKTAESLMLAKHAANPRQRTDHLHSAFLTKAHTPKKSLCAKAVREAAPALIEQLVEAQQRFVELWQRQRALRVVLASEALLRLSSQILQAYTSAKMQRAQLDFDDLIEKTNWLLEKSGGASWVLFKLDSGLDHILVDEAQDTSPAQWALISKLTEEFFAGKGTHENQQIDRTIFAVGDEKQSIYSFQGAQPKLFALMRQTMERQAKNINHDLPLIPLTLSFRSTPAVLQAVDAVFTDRDKTPGITFSNQQIHHGAMREGEPGLVEIWDLEQAEKGEKSPVWNPLEDLGRNEDPKEKLADNIALTIKGWLDTKELLKAKNRPIKPGDILILVRKRHPFTQPMIRALKRHDIPVAGADRMKIAEHIAVEDLMALGDFLLLPEDDLALATVLKSPMFSLDDDDLFTIRRDPSDPDLVITGKDGIERVKNIPLWWALKKAHDQGKSELMSAAYEQLARWMKRADKVPPYELFAGILDINGMREKLTSRLGSEAGDAINEFLSMALTFDDGAPPSLQEFLSSVRDINFEIKRDMEKGVNEVRIMTVHGAKGLEAEIVFMPDTTTASSSNKSGAVHRLQASGHPSDIPDHLIWCVPGSKDVEQIKAIHDQRLEAEKEEYNRLLYVAMTRARDQLYITGYLVRNKLPENSWYALVKAGLEELVIETNDARGNKIWRFETGLSSKPASDTTTTASTVDETLQLPAWMEQTAEKPPAKIATVSPSNLIPTELSDSLAENLHDDALDLERDRLARNMGKYRGILVHALLEHLPALSPDLWHAAAARVLDRNGRDLTDEQRVEIITEAIRVLEHKEFANLFAANSSAESSFIASIDTPKATDPGLRISGQIDRLVVTDKEVLIIDYKTNRHVPLSAQEIPTAYIAQLAAYRLSVRPLFGDKAIRCALLWTRQPFLMWLPDALMDEYESQLPDMAKMSA